MKKVICKDCIMKFECKCLQCVGFYIKSRGIIPDSFCMIVINNNEHISHRCIMQRDIYIYKENVKNIKKYIG